MNPRKCGRGCQWNMPSVSAANKKIRPLTERRTTEKHPTSVHEGSPRVCQPAIRSRNSSHLHTTGSTVMSVTCLVCSSCISQCPSKTVEQGNDTVGHLKSCGISDRVIDDMLDHVGKDTPINDSTDTKIYVFHTCGDQSWPSMHSLTLECITYFMTLFAALMEAIERDCIHK